MKAGRKCVQIANPADGGFLYWLLKLYLFGGIATGLVALTALPVLYLALASSAPTPPNLQAYQHQAELETHILSLNGELLTQLVEKHRYLVRVEDVPPLLIKAFLAAEDRSFFEHGGVDFKGIMRAAWANLRAGTVRQGGSTITQQVAKAYLSQERTIQRKLKEIVLARRIEARFSKIEILYLYLNHIFFGARSYGVKAAAKTYFGKSLKQLSLAEMAMLAGLVRAPSRYSPSSSPDRAVQRRNQVLQAMLDAEFINAEDHGRAVKEPLRLATHPQDPMPWLAPHFTEHVRRTLNRRYGKNRVYTSGWRVETTVDLSLQSLARERALIAVRSLDKRQGWRGPFFKVRGEHQKKKFIERVERLYDLTALQEDRPYPLLVERVSSNGVRGRIGGRRVQVPLELMAWAAPYTRLNAENERTIESASGTMEPGDVVWTISPEPWMRRKEWGSAAERVTKMALHQIPIVEGALYTYDFHSGYTLAMVGGLDYDRSTFNRCTQACRQPGSTYKPIYYSLALDSKDFSMATILQDKPYEPEEGEDWNPQNVHGTLDGKVTMHTALVRSLNLPSIELMNKVGAKETAAWARRLGFTTPIHADRALALGASCVQIDELTRAFATFARGGSQKDPVYIRRILDRRGRVIEDHTSPEDPFIDEAHRLDRIWAASRIQPRQIIDAKTAYLMTKLLRDSVLHGISSRCRIVPIPTGGKGGTSSDTMDVWFVGFTSQWATTAWIGDDNYRRPLGEKEASYTAAIPMWANYMKAAVSKPCVVSSDCGPKSPHILCQRGLCNVPLLTHEELPMQQPTGLKWADIDANTGGPPQPDSKTVRIYYRPGSYDPETHVEQLKDGQSDG